MRNLEIKVACDEATFTEVCRRARTLGASSVVRQRDTYFAVPTGRLKLREIDADGARSAEMVGYSRPDTEGARWSSYYRATFRPEEAASIASMMASTIGVRVVVEKVREVVIHRRTRIHLDQVENLGYYVELETVIADDETDAGAEAELAEVIDALGIGGLPAIGGSYSDLLEAATAKVRS